MQLEETRRSNWDRQRRQLRDKTDFAKRWVRSFRLLLNAKSDMLDPDILEGFQQHPVVSVVGIELTEEEAATALKAMANAKSVLRDGLPVELLKLVLQ